MATHNDITRSFPVSSAMSAGALVEIFTDGFIRVNTCNRHPIGVLLDDCAGSAFENPAVRLIGAGTIKVQAASAMTLGDRCYTVTSGRIASTNGSTTTVNYGRIVGTAIQSTNLGAAFTAGELIEIAMWTSNGPAQGEL